MKTNLIERMTAGLEKINNENSRDLADDDQFVVFYSCKGSEEIPVFFGTEEEAAKMEDELRKECRKADPDGSWQDVYTRSMAEIRKIEAAKAAFDQLTDEEKADIIEVNGRRYIRKVWEAKQGK